MRAGTGRGGEAGLAELSPWLDEAKQPKVALQPQTVPAQGARVGRYVALAGFQADGASGGIFDMRCGLVLT